MGEELKPPEQKKVEEQQNDKAVEAEKTESKEPKEEKKPDESEGDKAKEPPAPPEKIELRVYMHCEGCARKVRRCLRGFPGVEDVHTDCKTHLVIVKGKTADPLKVLDRVQKKSHRKVELLTPLPPPPVDDVKKPEDEQPKEEEKKEEPPVITAILKVHMHCEACAQEIQKRILKMKGVQSAEPDLKGSQVTVKGVFEPPKLVEYVYRRTGKHAIVVKQEPDKEQKEEKGKEDEEDKKGEEAENPKGEEKQEQTEAEKPKPETEEEPKAEVKKNEYFYYYPRYVTEYVYPPQIFSDENPNACSAM